MFGAKRKPELIGTAQDTETVIDAVEKQPQSNTPTTQPQASHKVLPQMEGRIPVTVRCKPALAQAIKRVSLQRQLNGETPYQVQEIMEEAISDWMEQNGYNIS